MLSFQCRAIVQAAGRALRPYEGKDYGYIMVPVVVPKGMDFDEFLESTPFRQVARVITALSTQDDRIAEQFRARQFGHRSYTFFGHFAFAETSPFSDIFEL